MKIKRTSGKYKVSKRCKCKGLDAWFGFKYYLCDDSKEYYFTDDGQPVCIGVKKG